MIFDGEGDDELRPLIASRWLDEVATPSLHYIVPRRAALRKQRRSPRGAPASAGTGALPTSIS